MPRPLCSKIVGTLPKILEFLPSGKSSPIFIELNPEEFESLRLCKSSECDMRQGASQMGVSSATFCRLRKRALHKVIDALCTGKGIKIKNSCE